MLVAANYILHRDAYLYIAQSDHLAWGFWSVPPLTAFLIKAFRTLFGNSVYALRLLPALTGVVSIFIIGDTVKLLGGKKPALIIALAAFFFSMAYLRSNALVQPVSNDEMFWLLIFYFTVKLIKTGNTRFWIVLGLVFGLVFLNKYLIVFLAVSLFLSFLLTENRRLLWSGNLVYGLGIGLIVVLPNIIWQYQHNWVVLYHMKLLREYQLVNVSFFGFLIGIVIMNFGGIFVWLSGLSLILFGKEFKPYRTIGLMIVLVILLIAILQGKPYYTLGVYSILFAFGGIVFEKYLWNRNRSLYYANLVFVSVTLLIALPFALPVLKFKQLKEYCDQCRKIGFDAPLWWEDGKAHAIPQDYADMTGWNELADIVVRGYDGLDLNRKKHTVIYAENYGEAGAIHFYGRKKGIPEPICFNGSFLFWAPDSLHDISTMIYVNDDTSQIKTLFKNVKLVDRVKDPYFREGDLPVWLCSDPSDTTGRFYAEKVNTLKKLFIRNH